MDKAISARKNENEKTVSEIKNMIYMMVDAISDKGILVKAYTFIKYLK